jgi:hypothetical protein
MIRALPILKSVASLSLSTTAGCLQLEKNEDKLTVSGKIGSQNFQKEVQLRGLFTMASIPNLLSEALSAIEQETPADENQVVVAVAMNVDSTVKSTTFNLPLRVTRMRQFEDFINQLEDLIQRVKGT